MASGSRTAAKVILALSLILIPEAVLGAENALFREYHTWGGTIDVVEEAFRKLALIMSSQDYRGLFAGMAALGILAGVIGMLLAAYGRGVPLTWAWMQVLLVLAVGGAIYLGFIRKTDTLHIYDETTNEMASVPDVPDGVITAAGFFNLIERGMIELTDTAGVNGLSYRDGTGGIALRLLVDGFTRPIPEEVFPGELMATLTEYFKNCYVYNVGLHLADPTDLNYPANNDLRDPLSDGVHGSVYTVWYDDNYPGGVTVKCSVAWLGGAAEPPHDSYTVPGLQSVLGTYTDADLRVNNYWREVCQAAGFNASDPAVYARCTSLILDTLGRLMTDGTSTTFTGDNLSNILRNRAIAESLWTALDELSPSLQIRMFANRRIDSAGIGVALMANEYIPVMKAAITAIFLGILPVLAIFLVTPLWKKVASAILGSFCFLCFWGVSDALVHAFMMGRVVKLFGEVASEGLGASNIVLIPTQAMKAMTLFGFMRMSTIFFAGFLSRMVFSFGGYMLAHFAQSLTSKVSAPAQAAGDGAFSPTWQSSTTRQLMEAAASIEASRWVVRELGDYHGYSNLRRLTAATDLGAGALRGSRLSGLYGGPMGAASATVEGQAQRVLSGASRMAAIEQTADREGKSPVQVSDLYQQTAWEVAYGGAVGERQAFERAQQEGFQGDFTGWQAFRRELGATRDWVQKDVAQGLADRYFGGDVSAFWRGAAELEQARVASVLQKLDQHGVSALRAGEVAGALEGIRRLSDLRTLGVVGEKGVFTRSLGERLNEISKFALRRFVQEVAIRKSPSPETVRILRNLASIPEGMAQLQHQAASLERTFSRPQARNVAAFFGLDPDDLANREVRMALTADRNGNLQVAMIDAESGQRVKEMDLKRIEKVTQEGHVSVTTGRGGGPEFGTVRFVRSRQFRLPTGVVVTVEKGTLRQDGLVGQVSGITREGVPISFKFERNRSGEIVDFWDMKVSPEAQLERDAAYWTLTENRGAAIRYLPLEDPSFGERWVNNYASTLAARVDEETISQLQKRFGGSVGLRVFGLGGGGSLEHLDTHRQRQKIVHGLVSIAYLSSFRPDGSFDREAFAERMDALREILWAKNRGAAQSHIPGSAPESVARGYMNPQWEQMLDDMVSDYEKALESGNEKVRKYLEALDRLNGADRTG